MAQDKANKMWQNRRGGAEPELSDEEMMQLEDRLNEGGADEGGGGAEEGGGDDEGGGHDGGGDVRAGEGEIGGYSKGPFFEYKKKLITLMESESNSRQSVRLDLLARLRRRGGNKFLFCPTKKNFRPIGAFLTILEALSCKTKYRKYLAKYPFPGIHICVTYFQYCNNEPDIPKSSIKQL